MYVRISLSLSLSLSPYIYIYYCMYVCTHLYIPIQYIVGRYAVPFISKHWQIWTNIDQTFMNIVSFWPTHAVFLKGMSKKTKQNLRPTATCKHGLGLPKHIKMLLLLIIINQYIPLVLLLSIILIAYWLPIVCVYIYIFVYIYIYRYIYIYGHFWFDSLHTTTAKLS